MIAAVDHLLGHWSGQAATISANWPKPNRAPCAVDVQPGGGGILTLHTRICAVDESSGGHAEPLMPPPDSAYCLVPLQVSRREAFRVEAGWLPSPGRLDYPHGKAQQGERLQQARYKLLRLLKSLVSPMADSTPRFGFVVFAETWNGRLAMLGFVIGLATEVLTGQSILSQIGLG